MIEKNSGLLIALALVVALAIHGFFTGRAIQRFRKEDRSISVRGFSEREVKANFAVWTIQTRITTNDLLEGSREVEESKRKIIEFLLANGIGQGEIIQKNLNVIDKLARDYGPDMGAYRYIIENTLQVRTQHVDTIQYVSRLTDKLLRAGIVIAQNDYNPAVQYLFTGLNDIKPQMLSEAIQNARTAAVEFTRESNVQLGTLKKANQGLFTIVDREASSSSGEGDYYASNVNDLYKKVRVVVNVEYSIE
jgi:uncharacterized protein